MEDKEIFYSEYFGEEIIAFVENEISLGNEYKNSQMEGLGKASLVINMELPIITSFGEILPPFGVSPPGHLSIRGFHVVDMKCNYTNARSVYFPLNEYSNTQKLILELHAVNFWISTIKDIEWFTLLALDDYNEIFITKNEMDAISALVKLIRSALHVGFKWNTSTHLVYSNLGNIDLHIHFEENAMKYYRN